MFNCTAGPNGTAWSVRPTSNVSIIYQITNFADVVSPTLSGLYTINQTGLIVLNAATTPSGGPIYTAGIYTVQFTNSTNRIAVKLVVIPNFVSSLNYFFLPEFFLYTANRRKNEIETTFL